MFDELLTTPPSVDYPAPEDVAPIHEVVAPVPAVSTGTTSSTTVDQDAPSLSNSQRTPETQSPIIPNDVDINNDDIEVAHMYNDSSPPSTIQMITVENKTAPKVFTQPPLDRWLDRVGFDCDVVIDVGSDDDIVSTSITSSLRTFILEQLFGKLAHVDLIPPGINETDFDPEEEIHLVEKLLYETSSPRPPKEFNSENSDAIIESFSPSPIPVEDSDSLMEDIDLFLTPNDSMPPGIENEYYDSKGDILFLEKLLSNDSPLLPENESFHFDVPSSPCPLVKPPDDGIYFEPDTEFFTKLRMI
ncbi:hypothetical protein Tco_0324032 [Tanacetum coccineum]